MSGELVPVIPDEDFERWLQYHDDQNLPKGLIPRDFDIMPYGASPGAPAFESSSFELLDDRSLWPDMIRQKDRDRSWPGDIADDAGIPLILQGSLGYCHAFATDWAVMVDRAIEGKPFVLLSASSIGGPITNYQNKGAYILDDLKQTMNVGVAPAGDPPSGYRMTTSHNDWSAETKEAAGHFKVVSWVDINWYKQSQKSRCNQIASVLMARNRPSPVVFGLNSMGHAMGYRKMVIIKTNPMTFGYEVQNSWPPGAGGFNDKSRAQFSEAKGTADDAYGIDQGK